MKVRLTPAAKNDVEAAYSWYRERGRLLARRFKAEVQTTAKVIGERPLSFQRAHRDVRRAVLRRFPYLLLFRVEEKQVVILGCFYGGRDPAIWQRRVEE